MFSMNQTARRWTLASILCAACALTGACAETQAVADKVMNNDGEPEPTETPEAYEPTTQLVVGATWSPTASVKSQALRAALSGVIAGADAALPSKFRSLETSVLGQDVSAVAASSEACPTCVSLTVDLGTTFHVDVPLMDEPEQFDVTSKVDIIAPITFVPRGDGIVAVLDLPMVGQAGGAKIGSQFTSLPKGVGEETGEKIEAALSRHFSSKLPQLALFSFPTPSFAGAPLDLTPTRVSIDTSASAIYAGFSVPGAPDDADLQTWKLIGGSEQAAIAIHPALVVALSQLGDSPSRITSAALEGDEWVVQTEDEREGRVSVDTALSDQRGDDAFEGQVWEATSWMNAPSYALVGESVTLGLLGVEGDGGAMIARYGVRIDP